MAATNVVCTVCVTLDGSVVMVTGGGCTGVGAGAGLTFSTCICDDVSKGGSGFSGSADGCVVTGGASDELVCDLTSADVLECFRFLVGGLEAGKGLD